MPTRPLLWPINEASNPGGHYWDYYPGILSLSQVTAIHLKISSTAPKQWPGQQMRPIKRSSDPDIPNYRSNWRPENFSCQSPGQILWLSKYTIHILFQYFKSDEPKIIAEHPAYQLDASLGDPGFFINCSTDQIPVDEIYGTQSSNELQKVTPWQGTRQKAQL